MRATRAVLEVYWVVSVQVCSRRNVVGIARPQSPSGVMCGQAKRVGMFSETVDVCILGQVGFKTKILRFEYDGMGFCGEENFGGRGSIDAETERCCGVIELYFRRMGRDWMVHVWPWKH